jgi:hypothetical protein
MMVIQSGSSTARIVRSGLLALLVIGFAALFLWDGYIGYPQANAFEALRLLGLDAKNAPVVRKEITSAGSRERIGLINRQPRIDQVELVKLAGEPSIRKGDVFHFLGPGGRLEVELAPGRDAKALWVDGAKTETDIQWQRWIGYALGVFGLVAAARFFQVLTSRVTLSETELRNGRLIIPLNSIKSLSAEEFVNNARVTIHYTAGSGEQALKLEEYATKDLRAIVASICSKRHLTNPFSTNE